MSLYIISIGGTGHRVVESLVHLMAAGAVPTGLVKIMAVDSDAANGNLDNMLTQIRSYSKVFNSTSSFRTKIETAVIDGDTSKPPCWSPTIANDSLLAILNKHAMDNNGKRILDSLFTEQEQRVMLDEGFYGHTSIGSLLMAEQIRPNGRELCQTWDDFFNGINLNDDKVLLIGSTFGGTGASGIPTISTILRQRYPSLKLGALLVMPYFKFVKAYDDDVNDISIDWTYFIPKTKAALSYYEKQRFDQIFNELYIIGEAPDNFMSVKYAKGSSTQVNKPHIIELYAASAVIDFIKSDNDGYKVKAMSRQERDFGDGVKKNISNMAMLVDSTGNNSIPRRLGKLMRFCVMYTKYYYHCIKENTAAGAWYMYCEDIPQTELDILYVYCRSFISWMRNAHLHNNEDGSRSNSYEPTVRLFNFSDAALFDFTPEKKGKSVLLAPLNSISDIMLGKGGLPDAQTIDAEFNRLERKEYDDGISSMSNLIKNLKKACEF